MPGFMRSRVRKRSRLNKKGTRNRYFKTGGVLSVRVGVYRVPYVGYTEFGAPGNNITAQPFIEPALAKKQSEVVRTFAAKAGVRYERAVKRAAKKAGSLKR